MKYKCRIFNFTEEEFIKAREAILAWSDPLGDPIFDSDTKEIVFFMEDPNLLHRKATYIVHKYSQNAVYTTKPRTPAKAKANGEAK